MKTTLLAALAVSLFSTAALAQPAPPPPGGYRPGVQVTVGGPGFQASFNNRYDDDFDDDYYRGHNWRRGNRRGGHYELRNVQQWVAGQSQQVWVGGACHRPPFSPVQVCAPGRYVTKTSPGYYTTVQQWVWVEHSRPQRWGRR
ncbi:MAG: hypothetical protein JNK82_12945 [Myxococcaceae bacterium]|nr:hypothetical protein [Myxococcaceae bacterium]